MKALLKESIMFFFENIGNLIKVALPFIAMIVILDFYSSPTNGYSAVVRYILWFASIVVFCSLSASLNIFLSQGIYNQTISTKDCIFGGIIYVPYILIVYLIIVGPYAAFVGIVKYFDHPTILTSILIILSVVVAYLGLKTSFTSYLIVLEEYKPIYAIQKSFFYTDGFILKIIFASFCLGAPIGIVKVIYSFLLKDFVLFKAVFIIGGDILFSFMLLVIQIAVFKIFCLSIAKQNQITNMA